MKVEVTLHDFPSFLQDGSHDPGESRSVPIRDQLWPPGRVALRTHSFPTLSPKALLSMAPFIEHRAALIFRGEGWPQMAPVLSSDMAS